VPLTGWLTQRFGAVRLFTMSVLLFVLTSWLCGFAGSLEMLVLFRVLQGLVAGPMIPLSQTLLLSSYPPAGRHGAGAVGHDHAGGAGGGAAAGRLDHRQHLLAVDLLHQRAGGPAVGLLTWSIYRSRETPTRKLPIDTVGLSLLVLWVGALQLMLDKGKELDWFASGEIITWPWWRWWLCRVRGLGADRRPPGGGPAPVQAAQLCRWLAGAVDCLRPVLRQCGAAAAVAAAVDGLHRTTAGMALAPVGILAILLTPLVGKKVGSWDPRKMATGAFMVFATVLWMRSHFTIETDFFHILIPTLIQGVAMAFFFIPLTTITLSGLTPDRIPAAAGLSNFVRITAGAMGTSIATTLWDSRATMHHAHLTETLVQGQGTFAITLNQLQAAGMTQEQALARSTG
jgi:DHA2 family multidrug resistance protein